MLAAQGGVAVSSLAALSDADAVFVMVMTGAQAMDVVGELKDTLSPGATIIVSATIQPAEMRAVGDVVAGTGLRLIDSPVSGGQFGADAGTLTLMVAAEKAVFEENREVLDAVGGSIFHVGEEIGMGQTVKAVAASADRRRLRRHLRVAGAGRGRRRQRRDSLRSLQQHPRRQYAFFQELRRADYES